MSLKDSNLWENGKIQQKYTYLWISPNYISTNKKKKEKGLYSISLKLTGSDVPVMSSSTLNEVTTAVKRKKKGYKILK